MQSIDKSVEMSSPTILEPNERKTIRAEMEIVNLDNYDNNKSYDPGRS